MGQNPLYKIFYIYKEYENLVQNSRAPIFRHGTEPTMTAIHRATRMVIIPLLALFFISSVEANTAGFEITVNTNLTDAQVTAIADNLAQRSKYAVTSRLGPAGTSSQCVETCAYSDRVASGDCCASSHTCQVVTGSFHFGDPEWTQIIEMDEIWYEKALCECVSSCQLNAAGDGVTGECCGSENVCTLEEDEGWNTAKCLCTPTCQLNSDQTGVEGTCCNVRTCNLGTGEDEVTPMARCS